jgi:hypothetical protein
MPFGKFKSRKENDIMNELNNLIQNEYNAMVGMDIPESDKFKKSNGIH